MKRRRDGNMAARVVERLVPVVVSLCLAGCAIPTWKKERTGRRITETMLGKIIEGRTTKAEVLRMFGPPTRTTLYEKGEIFHYDWSEEGGISLTTVYTAGGFDKRYETVSIVFDAEDVAISQDVKKDRDIVY